MRYALFCNRADGEATDSVVAALVPVTTEEVEAVSVVAAVLVQRSRPVDTVRATVVDILVPTVAGRRQENTVTIGF